MEQVQMSQIDSEIQETKMQVDTVEAVVEVQDVETVGKYTGQCKWFNDKLGYGFVTICDGDEKGKDIFVHHSGVKPLNSNYKTLRKGEYIQFNVINGMNGLQAVDVRGIGGGPLMCDFVSTKKVPTIAIHSHRGPPGGGGNHYQGGPPGGHHYPPSGHHGGPPGQWQTVAKKAKYNNSKGSERVVGGKRPYRQT